MEGSNSSDWLFGGGDPCILFGLAMGSWVLSLFGVFFTLTWLLGIFLALVFCLVSVCVLLLLPLPRALRCTYSPAIIGMGALAPQPPNIALLLKNVSDDVCTSCSNCNRRATRSWGYLLRLSGLVRPMHAQHKLGVLGTLGGPSGSLEARWGAPSVPENELTDLLPPHNVVERFSGWGGEGSVASPQFSQHSSDAAELHRSLQQLSDAESTPRGPGDSFWGAHYLPAAATAAGQEASSNKTHEAETGKGEAPWGAPGQCKACRLATSWLQPPAPSRQQLLLSCPSLSRGFTPTSLLLQHRLVQGILLYLQEQTRFIKVVEFDRQYWVTSVDGDVVLLHYYRHRTNPNACSTSWGPTDASTAGEGVGCTDSRFPHGRPHGLCGCRGILFIVGGIGAKADDLQVQHVVLLAAAKGFCVFFLSCLRGIEAPIANLPTDLTTSADAQAALAFILHLHVNGFKERKKTDGDTQQQQVHKRQQYKQQQEQQQQRKQQHEHPTELTLLEVDDAFRTMIMKGSEESFLRSIPAGFIPPVFLLGYSMGSCAVLRLLGSLGLQQALQQLQQQQQLAECSAAAASADEGKEGEEKFRGIPEASCHSSASNLKNSSSSSSSNSSSSSSRSSSCSSSSGSTGPDLSPFCRDLAAAVASEYLPSLEWLRFIKGAVAISNAMCLDSCIGSLDRAAGLTGRLCKKTMLRMYKTKQWMEPSTNYVSKGLDPGLVALSQMTSTLREIDLLTHLSICLTPASPFACTRVYYALTTCLPHMLLAPVPLLCLHALDDPIVEPLAVCRAAATVPKYNANCTYAIVEKGGHNLFQESFWSLVVSGLWQRIRNLFSSSRGTRSQATEASVHPDRLYVEDSFQARVAMEFITAVWRRCK